MRFAVAFVRNPIGSSARAGRRIARALWRSLPFPAETRGKLAGALFTTLPFLFFWSAPYKAWRAERRDRRARRPRRPAADESPYDPAGDRDLDNYVPLRASVPPESVEARAIAFYLPQFHQIPENDAWWGEGFTEWTKVRPAKPLFDGHYQPHEPGELGYYDLVKNPDVMARQAELARLHGLSAFCFYFYWFGGKRLLEAPLEAYLKNASVDFPFCLCWANENWSRRWDGREDEVLIAQDHSPADDIAFIEHVATYMRDPRYVRVAGKPLLLVYRPALLPSAKETAARWRAWARENGLGDLYLAYTQSFEQEPPAAIGFDAAIEFPPNNSGSAPEPPLARGLAADSDVKIFDWRKVAALSRRYEKPRYPLHRAVNPSWDNTPRRPRDGAVLVNSSPSTYRAWLVNARARREAAVSRPRGATRLHQRLE